MAKKLIKLTESDLRSLVKESVEKMLNEMPTGVKIGFKDDKRDVLVKFRSRARTPKFGLCKSDQRQLGVMYAEAFAQDREEVAERIYNYAASKQQEYARINGNGDEDLEWKLYTEMSDAFSQGDREYGNEDIWTDDDPQFSYWNNPNQFPESKTRIGKIIKESIRRIIAEKHRPSGVSRRIHTKDANGKKQSFDYIPNLPKYNKSQEFNQASKFQRINARPVEDPNGEDIDTVLKDGTIERKGLHLPQGYYNVNNVGGTEHWGIDPKTFAKKYEADPEQQGVYKPKGGPMLASNPLKRNTSFQAPWGGRMDMKAGSRILQDPNNAKDTYGIGGNEFDSTYKFDESKNNIGRIVKESIKKVLKEDEEDALNNEPSMSYEEMLKLRDSITKKIKIALGSKYSSFLNVKVNIWRSSKKMYIALMPDVEEYDFDLNLLDDEFKRRIERVVAKYGYLCYTYGTNDQGAYFVFEEYEDALHFMPRGNEIVRKKKAPMQNANNNDNSDNINLNDPNSGESIRRNYAGSNEWSSSSAMENPFNPNSAAGLRRMYGRRW